MEAADAWYLSTSLHHVISQKTGIFCGFCPSETTRRNYWKFISVINQLDAQKFCFTISLFHASTSFEHMCSSWGGQNWITQPLVSSHLWVCRCDDTISLFHASTCFEHLCSSAGGQNCITQPLVSSHLWVCRCDDTISLFHASTCFEHLCSSSGGQNCITHSLVSSHL